MIRVIRVRVCVVCFFFCVLFLWVVLTFFFVCVIFVGGGGDIFLSVCVGCYLIL